MDDKLILKILTAIPTNKRIAQDEVCVDGITADMLYELQQHNLLDKPQGTIYNPTHRRTFAGSEWIRTYHSQNRTEKRERRTLKIACATLVVTIVGTFFAALAAFPELREFLVGLLSCR